MKTQRNVDQLRAKMRSNIGTTKTKSKIQDFIENKSN